MSSRPYAVLSAAAVLAAVPFLGTSSVTPAQTANAATTTTINTVSAPSLNCTATFTAPFAQTQGTASAPVCANGTWVYDLPATPTPESVRRTETHWGTGTSITQYKQGQTLTHAATYTGQFGPAGQSDGDWHVIWQLHGPTTTGEWRPPVMTLNIRHGELRLTGGSGHPNQNWSTANYEWTKKIGTWTDGKPVTVKTQTFLSSDPSQGWVSVWVDGTQVLNQWRPTSNKGNLKPGTFYPDQAYVVSRNGIYRGTQSGTAPTYRQVLSAKVLRAG